MITTPPGVQQNKSKHSKTAGRWFPAVAALALAAAMTATSGVSAAPQAAAAESATTTPTEKAGLRPCAIKPNARNTGARGHRTTRSVTQLGSGRTLKNANVSSLTIMGDNVTVRNVAVAGNIFVSGGSNNVRIIRVTTQGVGISSSSNVVVRRANIGYSTGDAIHVTSDAGSQVRNVRLRYNFIHHPRVTDGSHYDGTQVRGVDDMLIECSTYRAGTYRGGYNAAIYLENANGGDSHVKVHHNWLIGNAFSVMVDAVSASFTGNRIGNPHWGPCYLGTSAGSGGFHSAGNVFVKTGLKANLCGQG